MGIFNSGGRHVYVTNSKSDYSREYRRYFCIKLSTKRDSDIVKFLDSSPQSVTATIKEVIRKHLAQTKEKTKHKRKKVKK